MIRLSVLNVLEIIFIFGLKSNNLQNVKTKKEMWHGTFAIGKYDRPTDRRSGNQRMVIKVRYTDCHFYAYVKGMQSDHMEGIYCKKYQWGSKIRTYISVSKMAAVSLSDFWIFVSFM